MKKIDVVKKVSSTRLIFLLDRSGSMAKMKTEAIGGFNAFVDDQKKLPGRATFTHINFDHEYAVVQDGIQLKKAQLLTEATFQPRGMTALFDAIIHTINDWKISTKKNEKTIFAILTDGEENCSKEFTTSQNSEPVKVAIREAEDEFGWEVLFLGANIKNFSAYVADMGIKASNAAAFLGTGKGMIDAINTISLTSSAYRGASVNIAGATMDSRNMNVSALYDAVASGAKVELDIKDVKKDTTAVDSK